MISFLSHFLCGWWAMAMRQWEFADLWMEIFFTVLSRIRRYWWWPIFITDKERLVSEKWLDRFTFHFRISFLYDNWRLGQTLINTFPSFRSLCSFDNSLLPLWSSSWTAQSIARHNTNKKFLFCFGDDESVEKEKINKRVILAEEEIKKFSELIFTTTHNKFHHIKVRRRKETSVRIISHSWKRDDVFWCMKRSKKLYQ